MIIMKIIKENTTYIQVKDLKRLRDSNKLLTNSLLFIVHLLSNTNKENNDDDFIILDEKNGYFEDVDWIINLDEIKDTSEEEIITICNSLIQQRNIIADKYNSFSVKDRIKHIKMLIKCNDLKYEINSYKDILAIKRGEKKLNLPDGIELPEGFVNETPVKKLINKLRK